MSNPAGWYPQADGQQRFWDGEQWTENFAPGTPLVTPPAAARKNWFLRHKVIAAVGAAHQLRGPAAVLVCPASATLNGLSLVEGDWPFSVSCADYFSKSPNAVVIDGADAASNRYGTPATSS